MPDRWSVIYYVQAGSAEATPLPDGHLIFRAGNGGGGDGDDDPALAACCHYAVRPEAGAVWLFPGGIPHAVLSMRGGGEAREEAPGNARISLAANFRDAEVPPPSL